MALTGIDTIQTEISALWDSLVGANGLQANLPYPILTDDIQGQSPLLCLHFDGGGWVFEGSASNQGDFRWRATLFINRKAHGSDTAEELLGQLITDVVQAVRDNVTGTAFADLAVDTRPIQPQFVTINGIPYRTAEIYLLSRTIDHG